jgi:hypothetical protein
MRIWHLIVIIFVLGCLFGIARSEVGRVAVIIFFTGLGELILGTVALMHLFKTIGSIGEAKTLGAHLEAVFATLLVLLAATISMNAVFWAGSSLLVQVMQW